MLTCCPVCVQALHGDMSQRERKKVLESFREGKLSVLVATDVVSEAGAGAGAVPWWVAHTYAS